MVDADPCALCGRQRPLTFHHLIPRTCHSNKWFKKRFSRDDMRSRGIDVCRDCHSFIHQQFSEKQLGRSYNTLEALMDHDAVQRFVRWVRGKR